MNTLLPSPSCPPAEPDGFDTIYQENAKAVYYLVLRLTGSAAQAEDITHDVFLKAFRNRSGFRGAASVRTWLYRIAINHSRNAAQTWHQRHVFSNADKEVWEATTSQQPDPLRHLETKELGERIHRTLQELSEEYRVVLLLAADENLSYEEIAALTDQTADAVRGKLYRARKAFIAHFQKTA